MSSEHPQRIDQEAMSTTSAAKQQVCFCSVEEVHEATHYFEGLYPGQGTEMLVISTSSAPGIHMYLKWQDVQFVVDIKSAVGTSLSAFLSTAPGHSVTVDIDDINDTVVIHAANPGEAEGLQLFGTLRPPTIRFGQRSVE